MTLAPGRRVTSRLVRAYFTGSAHLRRCRVSTRPHRTPRRYGSPVRTPLVRRVAAWCCVSLSLLLLVAALLAGSVAVQPLLESSLVDHISTALAVMVIFVAAPRIKRGVYRLLALTPEDNDNPDA